MLRPTPGSPNDGHLKGKKPSREEDILIDRQVVINP